MSNNTKIFSEAIAEAKAIRETAMANAKLALEEAFAPRIHEMMSIKLEAMSQEEDEMKEDYGQAEMDAVNDEISLEELLAELEGLEEGADMDADDEKMEENAIAEVEVKDEEDSISVDELKDIIRDIMSDIMGGGEEEAGEEEEGEEEMSSEDDLELEEILAEIASLEEGDDEIEEGLKDFAKTIGDKVKANVGTGGKMDQWIDKGAKITAKIAEPGSATKAIFREEELDEYETGKMRELPDTSAAGLDNIANAIKAAAKKAGMTADAFHSAISKKLFGDKKVLPSEFGSFEESKELEEAMNTIATLRSELNEVNLLNAKLLYVNKLFKAKNLNESQKVKVINAFDRAETVREAKNVFDTLNESLNTEKAKSQIKESLSFASKSAGVSDRQPIMEGNDFMLRMQKLAGII
jgi:hypothetical protein